MSGWALPPPPLVARLARQLVLGQGRASAQASRHNAAPQTFPATEATDTDVSVTSRYVERMREVMSSG
jgi:hypothetical protein